MKPRGANWSVRFPSITRYRPDCPVMHSNAESVPGHHRAHRTAGLRAFFPSFPLTQRHAVYVHNLEADLRPIRRDWVGRSSLKVAGSRSSSRKHPATGRPHRAGTDVRYAAEEVIERLTTVTTDVVSIRHRGCRAIELLAKCPRLRIWSLLPSMSSTL
jgi:hypothetical protein